MSEPYDGGECPACSSTHTGCYRSSTALMQGFGARCYDCLAVWHFPGLDENDPVCQSFADAAYSGIQQYEHREPARKNTVNELLTA